MSEKEQFAVTNIPDRDLPFAPTTGAILLRSGEWIPVVGEPEALHDEDLYAAAREPIAFRFDSAGYRMGEWPTTIRAEEIVGFRRRRI